MRIIHIPGWVDLQVNGYQKIDFSSPLLTLNEIHYVGSELLKNGTIAYCPTVISSPISTYKHNLPLIAEAMKQKRGAEILGVHLEGPFINPEGEVRGIHLKEHIIPPSIEIFEKILAWSNNSISIITLAPELPGSIELVERIVESTDIVVSIGHTMAGNDHIDMAVEAGVRSATHVGNGIPALIPRHFNPLWSILAEDKIFGLFITDGFHLPAPMIKASLKAKGIERFIITSDLTHFAGQEPGCYSYSDIDIILEKNGYLHKEDSMMLAGSTKTMMECMNYFASIIPLKERDYYKVGFYNPLKLINKKVKKTTTSKIIFQKNKFFLST